MGIKLKNFITKSLGMYINTLSYIYPKEATRITEKLISKPRKGKIDPLQIPEILQSSTKEILFFKNLPIQTYTWKGNDTIILLAHGWESNAARWYKLIPILRKSGATIIALDGPAHGLSGSKWFNVAKYSEFLTVVIERFNPKIVIGHSIGGTASVFHQYKHQSPSIEKIVLLGSPGELEIMVANFASILGLKNKAIRLMDKKFFKDHSINFKSFSVSKMVPFIKAKGFIAHDRKDAIIKIDESKKIASAWHDVTFIQTRGLGHCLQDDALYNTLYDFLFTDKPQLI